MGGRGWLGLVLAVLLPLWGMAMPEAQAGGEGAVVLIATQVAPAGGVTVSAEVLAFSAGPLHGEMVISRQGQAGTVTTRQARDFVLAAGETAVIATVGVSFEFGDTLTVSATVTQAGKMLSQSEMSVAAGQ